MKKFVKKSGKKNHERGKEIKIADASVQSHKVHPVNGSTRLLGTEQKVFRVASPGMGLPKWKKR